MSETLSPCITASRHVEHWCRAERLYSMKCLFMEGGSYTIAELATRFEVAENTIGRDLRTLSTRLGVPLICEVRWRLMDPE